MPGTWQRITNQPDFDVEYMLLLSDGRVMCHAGGQRWLMLGPDQFGQYADATWSPADPMNRWRRQYSACTLADGRVLIVFGWPPPQDHVRPDMSIEIFDPTAAPTRQWTLLPGPSDWQGADLGLTTIHVCPLSDAHRVLVDDFIFTGPYSAGSRSAIFDTSTSNWATVPHADDYGCGDIHGWTLLPDGSVLSTYCTPRQRYLPGAGTGAGRWISAGRPVYRRPFSYAEAPGLLLPDGRVWVANYESVFYTPPAHLEDTGAWTHGPEFPLDSAGFGPNLFASGACLLPAGVVFYYARTRPDGLPAFFECDLLSAAPSITAITPPALSPAEFGEEEPYLLPKLLLLLPTGQVLVAILSRETHTSHMYIYTPAVGLRDPLAAWKPYLTDPASGSRLTPGEEYTARGLRFNGMSQAVRHSEWWNEGTATNFPIIRLKNLETGRVWYCRTHNHSAMGVATGEAPQSTQFHIPPDVPYGEAEMCVIANGITGNCITVTIAAKLHKPIIWRELFQLIGNLADGPLFVLGPGGIRPVPPFGPDIDEKAFREQVVIAYRHIAVGLLTLNKIDLEFKGKQGLDNDQERREQFSLLADLRTGLFMLRELGDQLEASLKKK